MTDARDELLEAAARGDATDPGPAGGNGAVAAVPQATALRKPPPADTVMSGRERLLLLMNATSVAVAVVSTVTLVVYTVLTHRLVQSADRQVAIMLAQNETDSRPYLSIDAESTIIVKETSPGSHVIADSTDFVSFRFHVVNCGHVPLRFHVVDQSFDGRPVDLPDRTPWVLFPGRTTETEFNVSIPLTKVASLNRKQGHTRYAYRRLGDEGGREFFYERDFYLDLPALRLNFTKEDAN